MNGETDLDSLLAHLKPELLEGEYVFLTCPDANSSEFQNLEPIATFREKEGLTVVVLRSVADGVGAKYCGIFRMITLQVHSSLDAVGLTAAVATKLAEKGISANVMAAFHHDHIFVPADRADDAMKALSELQSS
jgi:hypothetical protein